jgi:hypothetical protein
MLRYGVFADADGSNPFRGRLLSRRFARVTFSATPGSLYGLSIFVSSEGLATHVSGAQLLLKAKAKERHIQGRRSTSE